MTPEQSAAYINAMVACAMIEMEGMKAANRVAEIREEYPAFMQDDFDALIRTHGIHHNGVITITSNAIERSGE